jgi:hypothetical protein
MRYNKFKLEDIEIGDEIYFDDVLNGKRVMQSNYDLFWTVYGKDKDSLFVNLHYKYFWIVDIRDVRYHNPLRK